MRAAQPPGDEPLVIARLRSRVEITEDDDRAALLRDQLRKPSHLSIPDPRIRHRARRQRVHGEHGQRSTVQLERRVQQRHALEVDGRAREQRMARVDPDAEAVIARDDEARREIVAERARIERRSPARRELLDHQQIELRLGQGAHGRVGGCIRRE